MELLASFLIAYNDFDMVVDGLQCALLLRYF